MSARRYRERLTMRLGLEGGLAILCGDLRCSHFTANSLKSPLRERLRGYALLQAYQKYRVENRGSASKVGVGFLVIAHILTARRDCVVVQQNAERIRISISSS